MSAKSICHALFVLVAVTLASGQYLLTTTYEDSSCTIENGCFTSNVMGADCVANTSCMEDRGFHFKQSCVAADPFASPPTTLSLGYSYSSSNTSCTDYEFGNAAPLNKCSANRYRVFMVTGCTADNSTIIVTYYATKTDCENNNTPTSIDSFETSTCLNIEADQKYFCPGLAPVAPPKAVPVAATPKSAPVAGTPKATTPAKSNTAAHIMISAGLVATMLIVLDG